MYGTIWTGLRSEICCMFQGFIRNRVLVVAVLVVVEQPGLYIHKYLTFSLVYVYTHTVHTYLGGESHTARARLHSHPTQLDLFGAQKSLSRIREVAYGVYVCKHV